MKAKLHTINSTKCFMLKIMPRKFEECVTLIYGCLVPNRDSKPHHREYSDPSDKEVIRRVGCRVQGLM